MGETVLCRLSKQAGHLARQNQNTAVAGVKILQLTRARGRTGLTLPSRSTGAPPTPPGGRISCLLVMYIHTVVIPGEEEVKARHRHRGSTGRTGEQSTTGPDKAAEERRDNEGAVVPSVLASAQDAKKMQRRHTPAKRGGHLSTPPPGGGRKLLKFGPCI